MSETSKILRDEFLQNCRDIDSEKNLPSTGEPGGDGAWEAELTLLLGTMHDRISLLEGEIKRTPVAREYIWKYGIALGAFALGVLGGRLLGIFSPGKN